MSERKPLDQKDIPEGRSFVAVIAEALSGAIGGKWTGWPKGVMGPDANVFAQYAENESGRKVLSGVLLLGDAITADMLRKVHVSALEASANLTSVETLMSNALKGLPPLERGAHSPEEFSRIVAEHYKAWAQFVANPVAQMATEANVKAATVHTWVREARLRGFLPPARRGKTR